MVKLTPSDATNITDPDTVANPCPAAAADDGDDQGDDDGGDDGSGGT